MEKKVFYIAILSLTTLIALTVIFIVSNSTGLPTEPEDLEECKTLSYNNLNGIDIVFFSTEEQAKEYSEFLFTVYPLNENKDLFNIHYIDSYKPDCELYKGIAILCYSKEIIQKASSCPTDYIVVLDDRPQRIRSSAYQNVMSININHPKTVFHHEFGHSFANLAEEYVPAKIPKGSSNCVNSCTDFEGVNEGCYEGCSNSGSYRSIENGVMRTLKSEDYGDFNEELILKKLQKHRSLITGNVISETEGQCNSYYYLVEVFNDNGNITFGKKTLEYGCVPLSQDLTQGDFKFSLNSESLTLQEGAFNFDIFTDGESENSETAEGEIFSSEVYYIAIPTTIDKSTLSILDSEGNTLISTDLERMGVTPCIK
jgi:hypothetical protein